MQHHLALYLLYAKLRCKPNSRTKVPIDDDSQKRCLSVCVSVCVCVYVPLMQPHRSTGGNQFTLTSFLHAHSRSRTHTHTYTARLVQRQLCLHVSVCLCVSAACFFFCCCSCCRCCCCFYFPFHEPILTRVLLFQLLTKQLVRRSGLTKRTRQRDERRTGVASY